MIFTTAGRILAFLMVAFGAVRMAMGFYVAALNSPEAASRYLGSGTSGQTIDGGMEVLALGIALGILAEISRSVRR